MRWPTTLSTRGQVVIPAAVRTALGLRAGEVLEVTVLGDRMLLSRVGQNAIQHPATLREDVVLSQRHS